MRERDRGGREKGGREIEDGEKGERGGGEREGSHIFWNSTEYNTTRCPIFSLPDYAWQHSCSAPAPWRDPLLTFPVCPRPLVDDSAPHLNAAEVALFLTCLHAFLLTPLQEFSWYPLELQINNKDQNEVPIFLVD